MVSIGVRLWPQSLSSTLLATDSVTVILADFSASHRSYKTQQCFLNRKMFRRSRLFTKEMSVRPGHGIHRPLERHFVFTAVYFLPKMNYSMVFMTGKMPYVR